MARTTPATARVVTGLVITATAHINGRARSNRSSNTAHIHLCPQLVSHAVAAIDAASHLAASQLALSAGGDQTTKINLLAYLLLNAKEIKALNQLAQRTSDL